MTKVELNFASKTDLKKMSMYFLLFRKPILHVFRLLHLSDLPQPTGLDFETTTERKGTVRWLKSS